MRLRSTFDGSRNDITERGFKIVWMRANRKERTEREGAINKTRIIYIKLPRISVVVSNALSMLQT